MIDPDKIINDARNLEVANRIVQEERVKSAMMICLSKDYWDGIGLSGEPEISVNSFDPNLASARVTGKTLIQGSERFFELQFDFRFSEIAKMDIGNATLHQHSHYAGILIPLSSSSVNVEGVQSINNQALSELIVRIAK